VVSVPLGEVDWATTTLLVIAIAKAVPMRVKKYFVFTPLNLNRIIRKLNQRRCSQKSILVQICVNTLYEYGSVKTVKHFMEGSRGA
jgi:hypothetical protein